ncbi:MAG: long-chain fatty acid--CoA ligase [Candidatus Dormibacteraeota bacterium]|nr:long-chain fatty acid--CoA ligase [Candidatus Dormibacteraeota bacterium]
MASSALPALTDGDVVAVEKPPGPRWIPLLDAIWESGAAVLPIDHRLGADERDRLLRLGQPTVLVAGDETRRLDGSPAEPGTAAIVATSGSGGASRLVELSRVALVAAVTASAEALDATGRDPWLCCIPVAHIGGLLVLLRHVVLDAAVDVHRRFELDAVCGEQTAVFTSLVPTQLHRLLEAGCDLRRWRAMLVGGAALPVAIRDAASTMTRIVRTYGLTESCGGVVYNGRPLRGTEMRIADDGEVQLRGATMMRRYRLDDAATQTAFTVDGWLRTRDAGDIDGDGTLHVHGRMDDAISTGGETVWPLEVETVLGEHPAVDEVAVVGRDDDEWGQRVVAIVVPASGALPTLDALRGFVTERLAVYKAPREIIIVDRLDRTALGKVRRDRLPRRTSEE